MQTGLEVVLVAVADASRRALVQRLAHGPATTGQLADLLPMSRPAVSQHIKQLQSAGLIRTTIVGRHRWHELETSPLLDIGEWIAAVVNRREKAPSLNNTTTRGGENL